MELYQHVVSLSSSLYKLGVCHNDVMCAIMPNSVEYIITLLAVPAIGAILTTVNPAFTLGLFKNLSCWHMLWKSIPITVGII